MLSGVMMAMLATYRKTFTATLASGFFNVGIIAGALVLSPMLSRSGIDPLYGMGIGVLLGGILQLGCQAVPLARMGLLAMPQMKIRDIWTFKPIREILYLITPRAMAQGAVIINLFVNTLLATEAAGTATYISSAQLVILVPIGLFGVASSFSSLPMLTEAMVRSDHRSFARLLRQGLQSAQWLALWSVIAFSLLAMPFCVVLFEHGRFGRLDSIAIASAICAYAIGIFATTGSKILQQGYFAFGDTRRIVINSVLYLAVNASLTWSLTRWNKGPVPFGIAGSIAATTDFCLNFYFLHRMCCHRGFSLKQQLAEAGYSIRKISALFAVAIAFGLLGIYWSGWIANIGSRFGISMGFIPSLAFLVSVGAVLGALFVWITKVSGPPSLQSAVNRLFSRFTKAV
jgi:putative peptidoglycan lipid II flippase